MIIATRHGHSFIEIENTAQDINILIDPFVTGNTKCDITLDQLKDKKVDYIIITHWHGDHIWDTVFLAKYHLDCKIITLSSIWKYLQSQWLENTITWWSIWWSTTNQHFKVKFVTAIHDWTILESWITTAPSGVVLHIWDKQIYHAWDTALTYDMKLLWEFYKIDLAFVPIWDYYTMWVEDAVIATSWISPKNVVPIHYNTWPVIKADEMEFARSVMAWNKTSPKVLKPWQSVILE